MLIILNCAFFIGLRDIGKFLADPYGDDLHDLSVLTYILGTINGTRRLLLVQQPPSTAIEDEMMLESQRPGLGNAYTNQSDSKVAFDAIYSNNNAQSNTSQTVNVNRKSLQTSGAEMTTLNSKRTSATRGNPKGDTTSLIHDQESREKGEDLL